MSNKNTTTILVLLLAIIAVIFWSIIPFYNQISIAKAALSEKQKKLIETEETIDAIKNLTNKYKTMQNEFNQINVIFPDKDDLANLIVNLQTMVSESGIFLQSINFQPKTFQPATVEEMTKTNPYNILEIKLTAAGDYAGFKNFIKAIEKNLRLMDVKTIKFNLHKGKQEFDINIDLETYYK